MNNDKKVQKENGMCDHGNFPSSCRICQSETNTKDGYPIVKYEDLDKETVDKSYGDNTYRTRDFQGYIRIGTTNDFTDGIVTYEVGKNEDGNKMNIRTGGVKDPTLSSDVKSIEIKNYDLLVETPQETLLRINLDLDPHNDNLAREKAKYIHDGIVTFVGDGGNIEKINSEIERLKNEAKDMRG